MTQVVREAKVYGASMHDKVFYQKEEKLTKEVIAQAEEAALKLKRRSGSLSITREASEISKLINSHQMTDELLRMYMTAVPELFGYNDYNDSNEHYDDDDDSDDEGSDNEENRRNLAFFMNVMMGRGQGIGDLLAQGLEYFNKYFNTNVNGVPPAAPEAQPAPAPTAQEPVPSEDDFEYDPLSDIAQVKSEQKKEIKGESAANVKNEKMKNENVIEDMDIVEKKNTPEVEDDDVINCESFDVCPKHRKQGKLEGYQYVTCIYCVGDV